MTEFIDLIARFMKRWLVIFPLLVAGFVFSQDETQPPILAFAKEVIGHPLAEVKDSMICAEVMGATTKDVRPVAPEKCHAFYYLPKDRNVMSTGGVGFAVLLLNTDSLKQVSSVTCIRSYESKGSWPMDEEFEADYKTIESFFINFFKTQGAKAPEYKDDYSTKTSTKWVNGTLDIILEKTIYSRKGNINKLLNIGLFVVNRSN